MMKHKKVWMLMITVGLIGNLALGLTSCSTAEEDIDSYDDSYYSDGATEGSSDSYYYDDDSSSEDSTEENGSGDDDVGDLTDGDTEG